MVTCTSRIAMAVAVSATAAALLTTDAQAAKVVNTYTGPATGNFSSTGDDWSLGRVPGTDAVDSDNARIDGAMTVTFAQDIVASSPRLVGVHAINGATLEMVAGADVYLTPTHWSDGVLALGAIANVNDGSTSAGNAYMNVSGGKISARRVIMANSSVLTMTGGVIEARDQGPMLISDDATVNLSGGALHLRRAYSVSGNGTINQTGGELVAMYDARIGGTDAKVNISGGETWLAWPSIGSEAGQTGTLTISGTGIVNLSREVNLGGSGFSGTGGGGGHGAIIISGGTLRGNSVTPIGNMEHNDNIRAFNIGTHATGTGLFKVIGNDASILINRSTTGNAAFALGANGVLAFDIDDATVSTVNFSSGTVATLTGTIDLGLIGGYEPAVGMVYDLLTGGATIVDNGFKLAAGDEANWTLAIVGTAGSGQTLQATYVPEPAGLALLGLAVPALLRRRRN